jgi:hypothetical protein
LGHDGSKANFRFFAAGKRQVAHKSAVSAHDSSRRQTSQGLPRSPFLIFLTCGAPRNQNGRIEKSLTNRKKFYVRI